MNNEASCLAWRQMRRQRHYPSLSVLRRGGPQAERHLAACPHCRTALEHAAEAAGLGRMLLDLPLQQPPASAPVPGDVRALRPGTDPAARLDEDGTYYNPPLLLVLSRPNANGCVRVSQIFDEPGLQAEGDVPLDFGLIAEAWNVYDVPCDALDTVPCAHMEQRYVDAVLAAAKGPFPALDEYSPLFCFRSDECRTGSFFSLPLNLENQRRQEAAAAAESTKRCRIIPFFVSRSSSKTAIMDQASASARLASLLAQPCSGDTLPLAAADKMGTDPAPARRAVITVSRPDREDGTPYPCAAEVRIQSLPGKTHYSILCRLSPPLPSAAFALRCGQAELLDAEGSWLEEDLFLIDAIFAGEGHTTEELCTAIILSGEVEA